MTKLLDDAVAVVRQLPSDRQDEIAAAILGLAEREAPLETTDTGDLAAIEEGLAQIERGEFASDDDVAAAFRRFGPRGFDCRHGQRTISSIPWKRRSAILRGRG